MEETILNIGGEDYSVKYSRDFDNINIESVFNLAGYFVNVTIDLEADILDKLNAKGFY